MGDSKNSKSGSQPDGVPTPATPPAASDKTPASADESAGKAGRVVHDARGNAVWNWVKDDARTSIDSTTHLLKRLELPELQIEDTQSHPPLGLEAERCPGGGYNPYGGSSASRPSSGNRGVNTQPPPAAPQATGNPGLTRPGSPSSSSSAPRPGSRTTNPGGGYDPYGKSVTHPKPPRKP